jgi:hypothetical protein
MHANDAHAMVAGESSPQEYLKFGLIIAAIVLVALVLQNHYSSSGFLEYLRWFMGVFFVVFASFKFIGYRMFALMFAGYDVVAKRFKPYSYAYPFIELGLGVLYLANLLPAARDLATIIVMGLGTIGVAREIKKRSGIHCACLGNVIKLPLSTVSLVEDASMGLMALAMLILR